MDEGKKCVSQVEVAGGGPERRQCAEARQAVIEAAR